MDGHDYHLEHSNSTYVTCTSILKFQFTLRLVHSCSYADRIRFDLCTVYTDVSTGQIIS